MYICIMNNRSVAISGYRNSKLALCDLSGNLSGRVFEAVGALCDEGYDTFYCGMADGFDLMVAQAVVRVKASRSDVRLIAAIPFPTHRNGFSGEDLVLYDELLDCCDERVTVSSKASKLAFLARNDFMLSRCSTLLCYYNGLSGGTRYTVRQAAKLSIRVVNICRERLLDELF